MENSWILAIVIFYQIGAAIAAYRYWVSEGDDEARPNLIFILIAFVVGQLTAVFVLLLILLFSLKAFFTLVAIGLTWVIYWTGKQSQGGPFPAEVKPKDEVRKEVHVRWQSVVNDFNFLFPVLGGESGN